MLLTAPASIVTASPLLEAAMVAPAASSLELTVPDQFFNSLSAQLK
jgi:hypothetical protein